MPPKGVPTKIGAQKLARLDEIGEEEIFNRIARGELVRDLQAEYDIGYRLWHKWVGAVNGRQKRYDAALMEAGHFFAERAVQTAQMATRDDVNVARLQVDTDKWMAAKRNAVYDVRQRDVSVNISIGDLHAQAAELLRSVSVDDVIEGDFDELGREDDGDDDGFDAS
jgi:hypothetical protein